MNRFLGKYNRKIRIGLGKYWRKDIPVQRLGERREQK